MLKVYLAAPYSLKDLMNVRAEELRRLDIVVTSTWLTETHKPTIQMHELTSAEHVEFATRDVQDVFDADILVLQTDETKQIIRAGRHVEFGIALGISLTRPMLIYVVGQERENIFHHLPQIEHFDSWEQTKLALCDLNTAIIAISHED